MRCSVITIFPDLFPGPLARGVVGRALDQGIWQLGITDLRTYADPPHYQVDDTTFGGGAGMVLKPEPLFRAIDALEREYPDSPPHKILLDPAGRRFNQAVAGELAERKHIALICGRYEGVDERVRQHRVDDEISIGDYVLPGGEVPAMVLIEAVTRLLPGVVGRKESIANDSFQDQGLDHPHFTRPAEFRGWRVPEVLLSGNHARIAAWRSAQAAERTDQRRPDLSMKKTATSADVIEGNEARRK